MDNSLHNFSHILLQTVQTAGAPAASITTTASTLPVPPLWAAWLAIASMALGAYGLYVFIKWAGGTSNANQSAANNHTNAGLAGTLPITWAGFAGAVCLWVALLIGLKFLATSVRPYFGEDGGAALTIAFSALMHGVFITFSLICLKRIKPVYAGQAEKTAQRSQPLWLWCVQGAGVAIFILWAWQVIARILHALGATFMAMPQPSVELMGSLNSPGLIISLAFMAVVLAPISEELLMRGVLQRSLKSKLSARAATLISAAAFATLHAHVATWVPLFAMGILLSYVYERTGKLTVPIIVHAAFNAHTLLWMAALMLAE